MKASYCFVCILLIVACSCTTRRNLTYFKDLNDTTHLYTRPIPQSFEVKIQRDDIIQILINSLNPEATAVFNLGNTTPPPVAGSAAQTQASTSVNINANAMATPTGSNGGYLVDKDGNIDFPVLGTLHVEGMTIKELKDSLKTKLDKYLTQPIVNVRLLNNKITVLGEVAKPSTYSIPSERVTVIDAIGMAGDLTVYGRRDNVLLIREENGERKFIRLNLNSSDLFQSPYYYLKQNDAIYVEADKSKVEASETANFRRTSLIISALSLIILAIYRLK